MSQSRNHGKTFLSGADIWLDHPHVPSSIHLGDFDILDGRHLLPSGTKCVISGCYDPESGVFAFDVVEGQWDGVRYLIPFDLLPVGFMPPDL